ncbi:MAG: dethiobiotin synthase [Gammaproteobacteria bacterium]|nr:dethiobiotin synthase [Gammaproteobacteria bacterium]
MLLLKNKNNKKDIARGFFITGTDTSVGKTLIAASITCALINEGKRVCAIKPIASGCAVIDNKLFNNDALILQKFSSCSDLLYPDINPFAFQDPVAPHLAAKKNRIKLSVAGVIRASRRALTCEADYIVIEGAGGCCTPVSDHESMLDLAKAYGYPVVLVVGVRLGCINHTVLTYEHMRSSGVKISGWIANVVDKKMLYLQENIESMRECIKAPLLGVVPYINGVNPEKILRFLELENIIQG